MVAVGVGGGQIVHDLEVQWIDGGVDLLQLYIVRQVGEVLFDFVFLERGWVGVLFDHGGINVVLFLDNVIVDRYLEMKGETALTTKLLAVNEKFVSYIVHSKVDYRTLSRLFEMEFIAPSLTLFN